MRSIGWAPNNASKWQMVYNLAFKGLNYGPSPDLFFTSGNYIAYESEIEIRSIEV
jgi:hypothetical protein